LLGRGAAALPVHKMPLAANGATHCRRPAWRARACRRLLLLLLSGGPAGNVVSASFCLPSDPCWPAPAQWAALNASLGGRLLSREAAPAGYSYRNASAMVYPNWEHVDGHTGSPSALPEMVVAAEAAADVQAALQFAAAHTIRVAVKSSGHSVTGRSTAPGALLLHLAGMQSIAYNQAFDDGCGGTTTTTRAVTVQPGVDFHSLYAFADSVGGVVVGGGGPTVSSAGGFLQGGGHSPLGRALGACVRACVRCALRCMRAWRCWWRRR
jgi:hypothetical protein